MSLREQARADFAANLDADGDVCTITYEDGTSVSNVPAKINATDVQTDPAGNQFFGTKMSVSVSLIHLESDLSDETIIEAANSEGVSIRSRCRSRQYDRTLGFVSVIMEEME